MTLVSSLAFFISEDCDYYDMKAFKLYSSIMAKNIQQKMWWVKVY